MSESSRVYPRDDYLEPFFKSIVYCLCSVACGFCHSMVIVDRTEDIADRLEQVRKETEPCLIDPSSGSLCGLYVLQLEIYDGKGSLEGIHSHYNLLSPLGSLIILSDVFLLF